MYRRFSAYRILPTSIRHLSVTLDPWRKLSFEFSLQLLVLLILFFVSSWILLKKLSLTTIADFYASALFPPASATLQTF